MNNPIAMPAMWGIPTAQIVGVVKSIGAIVGTYVIAKGWIPVGVFNDLLAVVVLLVTSGLTWQQNSPSALLYSASHAPGVKKLQVVVDDDAAPEFEKTVHKNAKVEVVQATKFWMG